MEPLFRLAEDDDHVLSVEGAGIVEVMEGREHLIFSNVGETLKKMLACLPCCVSLCDVFRTSSSPNTTPLITPSSPARRKIWPTGFGPGWFIRSFCPVILIVWCILFYKGFNFGLDLLTDLDTAINSPKGSRSDLADKAFLASFKHVANENFPANVVLLIRSKSQSVISPDIEQFSRTLNKSLICDPPGNHVCQNGLDFLGTVMRYDGYYFKDTEEEREAIKPYFVNGDESGMIILILHRWGWGPDSFTEFYAYLEEFIEANGPNKAVYEVTFANEQKLLTIAQEEVIYDFEHADLIGIPVAIILLISYCGSPAFLVLITLPVSILVSFYCIVQSMPRDLKLPTFAPSIIISIAVALSVDYALFMLVRYSEEIKKGAGRNFALDKAMSTAGKTISVSGTIMLVSNGCLYFVKSETVAAIGLALAVTNIVIIAANVTLLPAVLFMFGPLFDRIRNYQMVATVIRAIYALFRPFADCFSMIIGSSIRRKGIRVFRTQESHLLIETDSMSVASTPTLNPHYEDMDSAAAGGFVVPRKRKRTNSRIWAIIANACLKYPKTIIVVITAISIPVCFQILRFEWTDSQANLVPPHNKYVTTVTDIGRAGFCEGWLGDFRLILSSPPVIPDDPPILPVNCFDNNLIFRDIAEYVSGLPPNTTCSSLLEMLGGDVDCKTNPLVIQLEIKIQSPGFVSNWCPVSCNTCSRNTVLSKQFFEKAQLAADVVLSTTLSFMTMNSSASGGLTRAAIPVVESIVTFLGRKYTWERAKELVNTPYSKADGIDTVYRQRFHHLVGSNGSELLYLIRTPFQPYNELVHPWSNELHDAMDEHDFSEHMGPNDALQYRYFLGGAVTRLFDQVDQVFAATPAILVTAVVITVLGTSAMAFQSLLLGPRLLVTIALTLGMVYGVMVWIFQDARGSPEGAGLYWIVPVLATPIIVGCTLDYDSFVVARIFEMRLSGMSTEAAVFAGLQETGHVVRMYELLN